MAEWKLSEKPWEPASRGGGSSGFSCERPETGERAHCKPMEQAREVLGYLLAKEAGVAVPPTELGTSEGKVVAVSKMWGPMSMDVPKLLRDSPDAYNSAAFKAALGKASGLLVFHAWLGTGDLKDEHLVVRPGSTPNDYEVGSIDFALGTFDWPAGGAPAPTAPPGPAALLANRDPNELGAVVQRIGSISPERIRAIVACVPDDLLPAAEKDRISDGLVARQAGLRPALEAAGWL